MKCTNGPIVYPVIIGMPMFPPSSVSIDQNMGNAYHNLIQEQKGEPSKVGLNKTQKIKPQLIDPYYDQQDEDNIVVKHTFGNNKHAANSDVVFYDSNGTPYNQPTVNSSEIMGPVFTPTHGQMLHNYNPNNMHNIPLYDNNIIGLRNVNSKNYIPDRQDRMTNSKHKKSSTI